MKKQRHVWHLHLEMKADAFFCCELINISNCLLLWSRLNICYASYTVMYEMVCVHVCKTTLTVYIIICNCICIGVINCGWKNNVVVQIVACLNFYLYMCIYICFFFMTR